MIYYFKDIVMKEYSPNLSWHHMNTPAVAAPTGLEVEEKNVGDCTKYVDTWGVGCLCF